MRHPTRAGKAEPDPARLPVPTRRDPALSTHAALRDPDGGSQCPYSLHGRIEPAGSARSPVSQEEVVHQRLASHQHGDTQVIMSTAVARSHAGSPRPARRES